MEVILLKSQVSQHGGLEKYSSRIAQGFLDRGFKVTILTTGSKNEFIQSKISFACTKTWCWPGFVRMEQYDRFVHKYLSQHPSNLVFGMDRNRYQTHYRAGNGVHAEFLKSRSFLESKWKQLSFLLNPMHLKILELEKAAFENPRLQKLFTNSHMVREQILSHYRTDPSKIQVIHNGVEWVEMQKDFNDWPEVRKKALISHHLDPNLFHFLFIGNGYLRKGLNQLIHALSKLKTRDFHLSVIGKDSRQGDYQSLASKLNLSRHITFFGPRKDIRPFYQIADSLVIPSFYDPFANVTVEALAMGLFVVTSRTNGGHEVLTSQNGAVIPNLLEPDSIIESLTKALHHPKTISSAYQIRQDVQYLDFSKQLNVLIDSCLERNGF